MANKTKRPEIFGNKYSSCLVSSIAGFSCLANGILKIHLKSGDVIDLDFKVDALRDAAHEKLKAKFRAETSECNPCSCCHNNGKEVKEEAGYVEGTTNCEVCRDFDKFKKED